MIVIVRVNKNHLFLKTIRVPDVRCPLCNTRGQMEMSFYQLQLEAGWVRNTKKISASVCCKNCHRDVPVVRWDKELDTCYKAEKKQITVKTSFKAGKIGKFLIWLNIVFFGAIFLLLAGIFIYHRIAPKQNAINREGQVRQSAQLATSPRPGDLVLVYLFDGHKQTLFKITAVDAASDVIKAIASDKSIDVPADASEVPATDADFKPGNETSFSMTDYRSRRFTAPDKQRVGNIQMIYRK
ncbi:hypothetical protein [Chitinophaga nivalis]|uniref:Zinc-ribbon 15 domain-containing protein n=1 Tax=Chitinophaga nivalis TaxID=2991709 RepID=A0ABT3IQN5_9BACT|nr:hypothetical protein [Chitinophaga nivalis]MCW3464014.1 hypothetical protein [Chitinophaga nivalis]MCW3486296.1 hypothetical protein [Chitinophaga nivalis]